MAGHHSLLLAVTYDDIAFLEPHGRCCSHVRRCPADLEMSGCLRFSFGNAVCLLFSDRDVTMLCHDVDTAGDKVHTALDCPRRGSTCTQDWVVEDSWGRSLDGVLVCRVSVDTWAER
jgi:hypothetical protein